MNAYEKSLQSCSDLFQKHQTLPELFLHVSEQSKRNSIGKDEAKTGQAEKQTYKQHFDSEIQRKVLKQKAWHL